MNCEKRAHFIHNFLAPRSSKENKLITNLYVFLWASSKKKTKKNLQYVQYFIQKNIHANTYTWNTVTEVLRFEARRQELCWNKMASPRTSVSEYALQVGTSHKSIHMKTNRGSWVTIHNSLFYKRKFYIFIYILFYWKTKYGLSMKHRLTGTWYHISYRKMSSFGLWSLSEALPAVLVMALVWRADVTQQYRPLLHLTHGTDLAGALPHGNAIPSH